ncbi:hypothetical protein TSTA_077470 [Talaromyces stipitatus ATCC 10500]|uniref:Uncharacterized protein n=1 Tax=Talaromyces stipitatus (strain ATCC 10500 / CBS 375.48 / QM 6759 / NRRL 1006) TaxID=441959 RepID=B8LW19_TALSN|nr:uncharacterized protein TSTA_077470 [Talaromyces stipitatus ATCC 10500]EED24385.1 hypothetical protein TSTA_077470 [Talaromyces stipitatus ATCC 10500]
MVNFTSVVPEDSYMTNTANRQGVGCCQAHGVESIVTTMESDNFVSEFETPIAEPEAIMDYQTDVVVPAQVPTADSDSVMAGALQILHNESELYADEVDNFLATRADIPEVKQLCSGYSGVMPSENNRSPTVEEEPEDDQGFRVEPDSSTSKSEAPVTESQNSFTTPCYEGDELSDEEIVWEDVELKADSATTDF